MILFRTIAFAAILPFGALASEAPALGGGGERPAARAVGDGGVLRGGDANGQDTAAPEPAAVPDPDAELLFLDARAVDVRDFLWVSRIVVVMADTPNDPLFERQLSALRSHSRDFVERDVVVIFDAHPADRSPLRQVMRPRGFVTAIIDKDGEVKARRPAPRTGRELMAVIDRFPLRRQEILERMPAGR